MAECVFTTDKKYGRCIVVASTAESAIDQLTTELKSYGETNIQITVLSCSPASKIWFTILR